MQVADCGLRMTKDIRIPVFISSDRTPLWVDVGKAWSFQKVLILLDPLGLTSGEA